MDAINAKVREYSHFPLKFNAIDETYRYVRTQTHERSYQIPIVPPECLPLLTRITMKLFQELTADRSVQQTARLDCRLHEMYSRTQYERSTDSFCESPISTK